MKVPRIAEIDAIPPIGPILADICRALGIADDDLPDIVPDPPEFHSNEEAATWVAQNMPCVARKFAEIEDGGPCM